MTTKINFEFTKRTCNNIVYSEVVAIHPLKGRCLIARKTHNLASGKVVCAIGPFEREVALDGFVRQMREYASEYIADSVNLDIANDENDTKFQHEMETLNEYFYSK